MRPTTIINYLLVSDVGVVVDVDVWWTNWTFCFDADDVSRDYFEMNLWCDDDDSDDYIQTQVADSF